MQICKLVCPLCSACSLGARFKWRIQWQEQALVPMLWPPSKIMMSVKIVILAKLDNLVPGECCFRMFIIIKGRFQLKTNSNGSDFSGGGSVCAWRKARINVSNDQAPAP